MKKNIAYQLSLILVFCLLLASCGSRKNIAYLQNIDSIDNLNQAASFETILQPDDLLSIIVSAEDPELTMPFNLPQIQGNYNIEGNQTGIKTYLIDKDGIIDFPVVGKIKLAGLKRNEAIEKLSEKVKVHINNPIINLRILNFKISVIGEVKKSGNYTIPSERITLLEAISLAGDLTIYGRRDNVLIVREVEGKKSFNRINITKADFLNSPFYYLTQNDIVIIEPNKALVNSSVVGTNVGITISVLSLLATLAIAIFR